VLGDEILLTKEASNLIGLFVLFFIASFFLANSILLCVSLIPLFTFLLGILVDAPKNVKITRSGLRTSVWVGEVLEITLHVEIEDGIGVVTIIDDVPSVFSLVEGNNLKVLWKGRKKKSLTFSYKVRCSKRGSFVIPPVKWESRHVLALKETVYGESGDPFELTVKPRIYNVRRLRGRYTTSIFPVPLRSIVKIGPASTDFKDIRDYTPGDPVKFINWKATARRLTAPHNVPLVNEYEKEGRQTVWIFLNASKKLEVGSNIENPFEYGIIAAVTLLYYFLSRGYRLGMYIYNNRNELFYPETGMKQVFKLMKKLINLEACSGKERLNEAIELNKRFILRYNPLCIIVTCLNKEDPEEMLQAVNRLISLRKGKRRKPPILVVNILPEDMLSRGGTYDEHSKVILHLMSRPLVKALRAAGVSVLEWNPRKESFATKLLRQVKGR